MIRAAAFMLAVALSWLFTFAAPTSAEGAWILWSESWQEDDTHRAGSTESKWEVLAAAVTPGSCESARRAWIQRFNLIPRQSGTFSQRTPSNPDEAANRVRPVCLPDTEDPRKPKGQ